MESTDRMQVRDLIEKLQQFDPLARISVAGHGFEILDVSKGDDCRVYMDIGKSDTVQELEDTISDLENDIAALTKENDELKGKKE